MQTTEAPGSLARLAASALRYRNMMANRPNVFDRIYPRIFLPFLAALIAATTGAWWIATSMLGKALERRLENQLLHATSIIVSGSFPLTDDVVSRIVGLLDADLVFLDTNGAVARSTLGTKDVHLHAAVAQLWQESSRDVEPHVATLPGPEPHIVVFRSLGPERGESPLRTVVAIASLSSARRAGKDAAWWLGAAAMAISALLAGVGHRITRGITVPIDALASMADGIASGQRTVRVDVARPLEVGMLARALNQMATRLQAYEQETAERNHLAALGEIAARVAHEIRNPLTAIKLQVELLGEQHPEPHHAARIARLLDEIRRLELVVTGTLSLGRPMQLALRPVELDALVREVTALMAPQFEHRGVALETELGPLPVVDLDADRIKQVIFNLLINATDALPQGGTVRIRSAVQDPRSVMLRVEDSGPGIPEAVRERLFQGVAHGNPHGMGVGLLLSNEIVELHHGHIAADKSPELGGARFTITLPVTIPISG